MTGTSDYNILTANDIAKITGGNYRTVKRILHDMLKNEEITSTKIMKNNREVEAYYTTNSTIKAVQANLKRIRNNNKHIVQSIITTGDTIASNTTNSSDVAHIATDKENVTIYEVLNLQKKNNELENKIIKLQLEVKDLEMRNVVLDSDNKVKDKELLLITDKSKEFEKNYFEKVQEIKEIQKSLKHRNSLIFALLTIIVIVFTITITIAFVR